MVARILFFLALVPLCVCLDGRAAQLGQTEAPGKMFARAFRGDLTPAQRIGIVRDIARDHANSNWGDDALWVLAQVATMRNQTARSIVLRQHLLARKEDLSLEPLTRSRPIYRRSRLPEMEYLLEQTGRLYRGKPGRAIRVDVFPLVLHEELGRAYQRLGMNREAAKEYRRAAQLASARGFLARLYNRRAQRLEAKTADGNLRPAANAGQLARAGLSGKSQANDASNDSTARQIETDSHRETQPGSASRNRR
jgi:hypothetical protein